MSAQQFIVDRLNEPPFNMRLTLVAFDEKSPFELLEIVNAIMAQLSTEHQIDLRDETPDSTANRMTDYLKVLNFKQVCAPGLQRPQQRERGQLHRRAPSDPDSGAGPLARPWRVQG